MSYFVFFMHIRGTCDWGWETFPTQTAAEEFINNKGADYTYDVIYGRKMIMTPVQVVKEIKLEYPK